ncbi:LysR family transcriptional regulator [Vibrio breoganii]|uniref:LysR family transcriptional regulator n=1 Tax=Vibrio breoganii TaxID=553239 RepID=UPI000C815616|nr:LysR family transcriptional regulator [Vibrio breoganii]PMM03083.1 LysR family transcriptional regulator [Vibrio breoganii]PMM05074.1 LysR family transcriptional regulator [Vibrio breoganii]PMM83502.1 LysR family transcriptional regulator [Vibrio breoganii]PMN68367.1 LysR family transcriptional regulator [Vibrio breoganii]
MKGTTYNQLVAFQTIVEEGSIRGAARKLEMTAPTVSQSLKLLEANVGLTLFNRSTRRMDLTDAGALLYERTKEALSSLSNALESVNELSETPSGIVRITVPRFVYQVYLRPIYAEFCAQYPDIQLEISVSDAAVDIVREGFDLGIRFGDKVQPDMVAKKLTEPMKGALFASSDYLKKYGTPTSIEELKNHKYVQYRYITSNQLAPLELIQDGQRVAVEMPCAMIVNDTDLEIDAAVKGVGISSIIEPCVKPYFDRGELIPLMKDQWASYPGMHLYYVQNSQKIRRVKVLIDYLTEKISGEETI